MLTFNILAYQYLDDHFYKLLYFWFEIILFKINLTQFYSITFNENKRAFNFIVVEWC